MFNLSYFSRKFNINESLLEQILWSFSSTEDLNDFIHDIGEKGCYLPSNFGFWLKDNIILIDDDYNGRPYGHHNILIPVEDLICMIKEYLKASSHNSI